MIDDNNDTTDLPLGTVFPDHPYNHLLLRLIGVVNDGGTPSQNELAELEKHRAALWAYANKLKDDDLEGYGRLAARQYGFKVEGNRLDYPWMTTDYRRVGYQSDFFTCDRENRTLVPCAIDHSKPRVIVFATGRAFAEKNARLGDLLPNHTVQKARDIMSAQVHLVGSRLVQGYEDNAVQVAAVAYDMVTSEEETPALRIQTLLDPSRLHQVGIRAAERIFGPIIGEFETFPTGRLVRRDGQILGEPKSDDEILAGLSRLVLVGGSVGCIITLQAARWLDALLLELGIRKAVRERARRCFMVVNLGPTTPLQAGETNVLSAINLRDEFVFAGNHIAPYERRVKLGESRLMPENPERPREQCDAWVAALEVGGTVVKGEKGFSFDPSGSHFGHSIKHYTNGLRALGVDQVLRRVLSCEEGFHLGELIEKSIRAGEIDDS